MVLIAAHHGRLVLFAVFGDDRDGAGAGNDVIVGHDVAFLVPYETGTGALRHFEHVHRPEIAPQRRRGYEHHGAGGLVEYVDGKSLVGGEVGGRGHFPRLGIAFAGGIPPGARERARESPGQRISARGVAPRTRCTASAGSVGRTCELTRPPPVLPRGWGSHPAGKPRSAKSCPMGYLKT